VGYIRYRAAGIPRIFTAVFCELWTPRDEKPQQRLFAASPAEGETRFYKVMLDLPSGEWSFTCDDTPLITNFVNNGWWKNRPGTGAVWAGEVANFNDDMSGTQPKSPAVSPDVDDPCYFSSCGYYLPDKTFQWANIKLDIGTQHGNLWGYNPNISPIEFQIWNKPK
jgi:hypothetical protein